MLKFCNKKKKKKINHDNFVLKTVDEVDGTDGLTRAPVEKELLSLFHVIEQLHKQFDDHFLTTTLKIIRQLLNIFILYM